MPIFAKGFQRSIYLNVLHCDHMYKNNRERDCSPDDNLDPIGSVGWANSSRHEIASSEDFSADEEDAEGCQDAVYEEVRDTGRRFAVLQ